MTVSIFTFSKQACRTALKVSSLFADDDTSLYTVERLLDAVLDTDNGEEMIIGSRFRLIEKPFEPFFKDKFDGSDLLVFVGSCGIAVRKIAPFVKSKKTDPAVIVTDELGHFVISLLSEHIGGANRLAKDIAEHLGSIPVITTATDINNRFSADTWAAENGYSINDMQAAKAVSGAILEHDVPVTGDMILKQKEKIKLPPGLYYGEEGEAGIYFGILKSRPFAKTMRIIPKSVRLGIGCRKGISKDAVQAAADSVLENSNIDRRAVAGVFSIDIKAEEPGLLEYCRDNGWTLKCYSADQLNSVEGDFSSSSFVKSITGADNVCERAALIEGDELIIRKTAKDGVTVAAAIKYPEVSFE